MAELLRMEGITKQFGAVYANKDINLSIEEGEIHTLLGENGAGKSTLMNILIGLYQPTSGTIWLKGKKVKIDSPKTAVKLGIGMVHQHFMLVDAMTVFENIILGTKKDSSIFIKKEERKKEILELSQKYGLEVDLDKQVNEISVGEQQRGLYGRAWILQSKPGYTAFPDERNVGKSSKRVPGKDPFWRYCPHCTEGILYQSSGDPGTEVWYQKCHQLF